MLETSSWIAIVDDDLSVLKALRRTLRVRTLQSKTYGSAQEFLASLPDGLPECLIVDLQMPEMTGLELHHNLIRSGIQFRSSSLPHTAISGYGNAANPLVSSPFFRSPCTTCRCSPLSTTRAE